MAKIQLPMHCPEDMEQWLKDNHVAVRDIDAPYTVEFEAPLQTLIDMLYEGWVDNNTPLVELMGGYVTQTTGLDKTESWVYADLLKTVIRRHTCQPDLKVYVDIEGNEFVWFDDDEQCWQCSTFRFFQDDDVTKDCDWHFEVSPMPVKSFM